MYKHSIRPKINIYNCDTQRRIY